MSKPLPPDDPTNLSIGRKIKSKRRLAGLTQEQLAQEINVSRVRISHFENGQKPIPATQLYKIARVLGFEISDFYSEQQDAFDQTLKQIPDELTHQATNLLRDFNTMQDPDVRDKFLSVLSRMAELSKKEQD